MATPEARKRRLEDTVDPAAEDSKAPAAAADEQPKQPVQQLMPTYYAQLFPFQQMHRWLAYGNDSKHSQADPTFFPRREFCLTLDGDIFVRYQSFKDAADMEREVRKHCPSKIDIGPVYNHNPKERAKYQKEFKPVQRELVFDIDLTDYDDVRTCGKEGHICSKCWPLMAVAVRVIDAALREDFGFQHILWVYSGRRGVHCWVCDASAREMLDEVRSSLVSCLSVYKGHEKDRAKLAFISPSLHPQLQRAHAMLEEAWLEHVLPEQQLLEDSTMQEQVLKLLPDGSEDIAEKLRRSWSGAGAGSSGAAGGSSRRRHVDVSVSRWHELRELVEAEAALAAKEKKWSRDRALRLSLQQIVFAFTYPRLDVEVSKRMNHLLKAPFCVHPKTGKVCVPLDPDTVWEFDPDAVPTVHQLVQELRETPAATPEAGKKAEAWRRTSMAEAVSTFESKFLNEQLSLQRSELMLKAKQARERGGDVSW